MADTYLHTQYIIHTYRQTDRRGKRDTHIQNNMQADRRTGPQANTYKIQIKQTGQQQYIQADRQSDIQETY